MNTAFLLLSTAWLAAGDPVVASAPHGCPNGCGCATAPCGDCCNPCCCDCCYQGPGLLTRLLLALQPCCCDCCCNPCGANGGNGCNPCCDCCCCKGPNLFQRLMLALPRPCCACPPADCCGQGAAKVGHIAPKAAPAVMPDAPPGKTPERIGAPKELPEGDAPKIGAIPSMENLPLVGAAGSGSPF